MRKLDWTSFDVLVVDDEQDNLDAFRLAFRKGFRLHFADGGESALEILGTLRPAVVVADQRMPGIRGVDLLRRVKELRPEIYTILLTAYADLDALMDALNSGAVDRYVQKPWDPEEFAIILRQGISSFDALTENLRLREQLAQYAGYLQRQQHNPIDFGPIVGGGPATQDVLTQVEEVAATATPVVIEGESGLEKDVVARAIHVGSAREEQPFVSVTCAAFPGDALERELFGYRRGAFEGALIDRVGRIELADSGTLWLREPLALSPRLQAGLLRMLVDGQVERIGDTEAKRIDVRLIISLTPNLNEALGPTLLPELRSRLAVYPIALQPLRERPEDIRPLAEHFLRKYGRRNARAATEMAAEAVAQLERYQWPGNVRELENVVERAAIVSRGQVIEARHLLFQESQASVPQPAVEPNSQGLSLSGRLDAIERRALIAALEKHAGNKAEVARALGIHRTTLYYRLKKLGIDA